MRSFKGLLLASALLASAALPALANGSNSGDNTPASVGTFSGSLNGGFTTGSTIVGNNNFGTEAVGSINSTLQPTSTAAAIQGSSYAISGGISAIGADGVGTLSGGTSAMNMSGSAAPGATFSGTADSFSEGTTGMTLTNTTYGNVDASLANIPVSDIGF